MRQRIFFVLITLFWATMNVLLWRSEFRGAGELGAPIPVAAVWEKMLRAPDDSNLEIFHHKARAGSCRWSANADEAVAMGRRMSEDFQPDGMVRHVGSYTIDVQDGFVDLGEGLRHLRFSTSSRFSTNDQWEEFHLTVSQRPVSLEVAARAREEKLTLKVQDDEGQWQKFFTFAELRDPEKLLKEFGTGLPLPMGVLSGMLAGNFSPGAPAKGKTVSAGLEWHARNDWMQIGHSRLRVYRLQAHLFGKYDIVVFVSRVGEVLRAELPDEVVLVNSRLINP